MSAAVLITWRGDAALAFHYRADVVDALKAQIPAPYRAWQPERKTWAVDAPFVSVAVGILRAAFGEVAITDERDATRRPEPPPRPRDAYSVLHLRETAPGELIEAAYRVLARMHHPDAGGDTEQMQALNAAYQEVKP